MDNSSFKKNLFAGKFHLFLPILFTLFFLLRFYHLGFYDFWYDEVFTAGYAKYPWVSWNPPLYWILLHFWVKVFGFSELSLRFPSLVFSFLSCVLLYITGKKLFNERIAIVASIFMGLSPFQVWYAQEARSYSMLLFLSLLSTYLFYKASKRDRNREWLFFTIFSLAGLYTNYFFIFLILSQFLYFLLFSKKASLKALIYLLLIPLGFLPYLSRFLSKFFAVWNGFWVPTPKIFSLIWTVENFILGYNVPFYLYILADIGVVILLVNAILNFKKKEFKQNFLFCLFFFLVPITAAFLFSKMFFSVYLDRGLIFASPYLYLILSFGAVSFKKKTPKVFNLALIFFLMAAGIYLYYKNLMFSSPLRRAGVHPKKPIKPLVSFLDKHTARGDIVAFTNDSIVPSFFFYSQKKKYNCKFYFFFVPHKAFDSFSLKPLITGDAYHIPVWRIKRLKFNNVWIIASNWERDGGLDENSLAVKKWLDNNLDLVFKKEINGAWIFKYVHKRNNEK
jgi:uncharacterized membrane protein